MQAPYGHGDQTVVNKQVRDTWEIEPDRIRFGNSAWTTFMDGVVKTIWQHLGMAPSRSSPRCELYKLLLYETGSQSVSKFS